LHFNGERLTVNGEPHMVLTIKHSSLTVKKADSFS